MGSVSKNLCCGRLLDNDDPPIEAPLPVCLEEHIWASWRLLGLEQNLSREKEIKQ